MHKTISDLQPAEVGAATTEALMPTMAAIINAAATHRRNLSAALLGGSAALFIWIGIDTLPAAGRMALIVLALSVIGWAMTDIPDSVVGLFAVAWLGAAGIVESKALYGTLGDDLIWLLVAALIVAAILRQSGLIDLAMDRITRRVSSVRSLFLVLTFTIAVTAFLIPSTSARAAVFLPVYLAVASRIESANVRKALALMFPTVILLSAGGSLIGAGAHMVAADFILRTSGTQPDYFGWAVQAMPFAALTSLAATLLILHLFVSPAEQASRLQPPTGAAVPTSNSQRKLAIMLTAIVGLWMTSTLHGIDVAIVGIGGIAVMLLSGVVPIKSKDAFKAVDLEMIVFIATTLVLIQALTQHGVDRWIAVSMLGALPEGIRTSTIAVVIFVAAVSVLAHLIITSRSARASVLIPTVTMPLAALGHDPVQLIMVTVLGTGFCQTLTVSSKPIAIFSKLEETTFSGNDLMRLSLYLMPMMLATLVAFALVLW